MTTPVRGARGAGGVALLWMLALEGGSSRAADPPPPVAPPPVAPAPVVVAVCAPSPAPSPDPVASWLAPARAAGVAVSLLANPPACEAPDGSARPPPGTDVVVRTWRGKHRGSPIVRTRIAFAVVDRLDMLLYGRPFSAALASYAIEFPARVEAPDAMTSTAAAADPPPEAQFLDGIVTFAAYRHEAPAQPKGQVTDRVQALRARAQQRLEDADRRPVEYFTPSTSATIKQLRAALILEGTCSEDTVAGLLRAAARLVPHDAEARAAAAIARLDDGSASRACLRSTEGELLQSLALDRWSEGRVQDLGRFYELAMNAASGGPNDRRTVPADVAAARLEEAWHERAPAAPRCLEVGVGAGFASAPGGEALRGSAPAARLEVTFARDSAGFGLRLAATLPWTRELALGPGTASWTRLPLSVGGRYRNRVRRFYFELDTNLALAPVFAAGHGFQTDLKAVGLDAGAGGGARIGLRFGRTSIWAAAGASYYFARRLSWWPDVTLRVDEGTDRGVFTNTLPDLDLAVLVGISQMLWR